MKKESTLQQSKSYENTGNVCYGLAIIMAIAYVATYALTDWDLKQLWGILVPLPLLFFIGAIFHYLSGREKRWVEADEAYKAWLNFKALQQTQSKPEHN